MDEHNLDKTQLHDRDAAQNSDKTQVYDRDTTQIHSAPSTPAGGGGATSTAGRFTLHECLGVGGFAEVFLAEDLETGQKVALKRLLPDPAASSEIVHRFQSVAEHTRDLDHPNIIAVYGHEWVDGVPAIVMEYVPGESLRKRLEREGALAEQAILEIALPLCDALTHAHQHGFIHRDVKPDNVLITPEGVVKLGDFDIAKVSVSSAMTRIGARMGTPYYMSPEQLRDAQDVDARSDVFSMGVLLFEMATGEVPTGRFGHPSELNPDLPRRLGSVILKALARDRGARYDSIQELRDALTGSQQSAEAQERPFYFRNQARPAGTIGELIEYCERDWESARWHLEQDHFDRWLTVVEPDLAQKVRQAIVDEPDPDLALERLVHELDSTLPDPVLAVNPEFEIDLGEMAPDETRSQVLAVSNPSRGYLVGSIDTDATWLSVSPQEFRLKEGESISVSLKAQAPSGYREHTGQVSLESNGGTILVPVRLQTAHRLLFPQADRSAGTVKELVELCNRYRDEAIDLFYSKDIERWLETSVLRFDLVHHAQTLRQRHGETQEREQRETGLRTFLLYCDPEKRPAGHEPFTFRTGDIAETVPDLVQLCESHWDDAKWHLYEGHFATWLEIVEPVLVAETERIRETEKDRDLGVERFLHLLVPDLPNPQLQIDVDPPQLDFGKAAPGERVEFSVTVRNAGRGYLSGLLTVEEVDLTGSGPLDLEKCIIVLCPACGAAQTLGSHFCRQCGETLDKFGCMPGGSSKFRFVLSLPKELGTSRLTLSAKSNGGQEKIEGSVEIARRLLLPEAGFSVGSMEELARAGHDAWKEVRTLWTDGQIREWLHQGLRRFDWVDVADHLKSDPALSTDVQIIRFMLHTSPESQPWLPPYLQLDQKMVDLGEVLNRAPPYVVALRNLGGDEPRGIRVTASPSWLRVTTRRASTAGIELELWGDARDLKGGQAYRDTVKLEWLGTSDRTTLAPQHFELDVRMQAAKGIQVGQRRLAFEGKTTLAGQEFDVWVLWIAGIGLAALLVGILIVVLAQEWLWAVATWLLLWLAGSVAWAMYGLGWSSVRIIIRQVIQRIKQRS